MKLVPIPGKGNEYLKRPVDSPIIWVDRFKKGFGRKQVSTKTQEIMDARDFRDKLFSDWLGEKKKHHKKVKALVGELWSEWSETKSKKSKATQESIKNSWLHLEPFIAGFEPGSLNESWWENTYIPQKRDELGKERRFFNDHKWLQSFIKFLHREGRLDRLPRLINPDSGPKEGLNLTDSEIKVFYDYGNEDLELQTMLGFEHFLRRSEALLAHWSEFDMKKGIMHLPKERTKIRKKRDVPINDKTMALLEARRSVSKSPYVFPSPVDQKRSISRTGNDTAWKNAIEWANEETRTINPEATFHDLRHSGLSRAFVATNRYLEICVMAGLSLEEAQRTYLHIKPDQTRFVADLVASKMGFK